MAMKWESNVQERLFTICATINDIDYKFGWNYIGCENCLTKLTQQRQQYYCPLCDMTSKYPAPRFKIQLRVSDETSTTTFTMFDKEAQKLLNTTATQLLEKLDNIERPSTLQNLCNRKLIFEIRLSDKNLKEGSQTYTITRTFVPANIFLDTTNSIHIKQEPKSPQPSTTSNSKDKEDIKQKGKIHEEVDYRDEDNDKDNNDNQLSKGKIKVEQNNQNIQISSTDEDTIKTKITKKKKIMVENITSSDEEPILLRTLRGTKKKKPKEKQSGSSFLQNIVSTIYLCLCSLVNLETNLEVVFLIWVFSSSSGFHH
uniref:Uncharacterized protein LOC101502235 n=1 Tax=Cicer arietinum TaxID=3827 RepID=A0A1S2Z8A7_CICAR|nr:uncharacterized protein LOC101502235 [Cicer arietinum]